MIVELFLILKIEKLRILLKNYRILEKDELIQSVLGEHISRKFVEAKEAEWTQYRAQVTPWEIEEYLYKI